MSEHAQDDEKQMQKTSDQVQSAFLAMRAAWGLDHMYRGAAATDEYGECSIRGKRNALASTAQAYR
jgi:hypothetical protein